MEREIDDDEDADRTAGPLRRRDACAGAEHARSRQALEAKRQMGVIPEDLALFDNLTARIPDVRGPHSSDAARDYSEPN